MCTVQKNMKATMVSSCPAALIMMCHNPIVTRTETYIKSYNYNSSDYFSYSKLILIILCSDYIDELYIKYYLSLLKAA